VVNVKPIVDDIADLIKRNPGNRELIAELKNVRTGLMNKKVLRTDAEEVSSVLDGIRSAMGKEDNKFIGGQLSKLQDKVREAIPGRAIADKVFALRSKPVNEMQVGQELEKALTKPIGEGERAAVFGGAMREAPKTIQRAIDFKGFENLEDVLKPENLAKAKDVLADLARKAEFERLAPIGRAKAAEMAQPFGLPATGPLHQSYMIFKTVLGRVSKGINEKTLDTMADALQVPAETLRLLQKVPTAQQAAVIDQIIGAKLGRGAIAAGASLAAEGIDNAN
jgi:hypothetical protein